MFNRMMETVTDTAALCEFSMIAWLRRRCLVPFAFLSRAQQRAVADQSVPDTAEVADPHLGNPCTIIQQRVARCWWQRRAR